MREIKFRGRGVFVFDATRPDWYYGNLLRKRDGRFTIRTRDDEREFYIDHATVGQVTGLKDCEGREIYEGDVIQVVTKNPYWAFKKNYDVYWDLDGFCLEGEPLYYWFKLHDLKVIGNVHDNPELLEQTP